MAIRPHEAIAAAVRKLELSIDEADRRLEELWADARVDADGVGDLGDVGAGHLAQRRDRVDRRDALLGRRAPDAPDEEREPSFERSFERWRFGSLRNTSAWVPSPVMVGL